MSSVNQNNCSIQRVVFIGSGNLATHLAKPIHNKDVSIQQVYSRSLENANLLANQVGAKAIDSINELATDADLYVVALRDNATLELLPNIMERVGDKLVVHTAGCLPRAIFEGYTAHCGVIYPMQTFSKCKDVDFSKVHFFIESKQQEDLVQLQDLLADISPFIHEADSDQRKKLHLAAVFVCNFTNHMYVIASDILDTYGLPFDAMLSLIDETTSKVHSVKPIDAQTGPAVRNDTDVMNRHLAMLAAQSDVQEIYRKISNSIIKYNSDKK